MSSVLPGLSKWLLVVGLSSIFTATLSTSFAGSLKDQSISCGAVNKGKLLRASELPRVGKGYLIPSPWYRRGRRFGTDSLVELIHKSAEFVNTKLPGGTLAVADISKKDGGAIGLHKSHQSGRDVDLIFYALDDEGRPFKPDSHMAYYGDLGEGITSKAPLRRSEIKRRFFDLARNWQLISYFASQDKTLVTHVFVSKRVKNWLLQYASHIGEPKALIKKVRHLLKKDRKGLHNDHFHVRIGCGPEKSGTQRCFNNRTNVSNEILKSCTEHTL